MESTEDTELLNSLENIKNEAAALHIIVFGPSHAGKSSLINRVFGSNVAMVATSLSTCTMKTETYKNKDGSLLITDTRGIERHSAEPMNNLNSLPRPDVLWFVVDYSGLIEEEDLFLLSKFPDVPAFIIVNKADIVLRKGKDEDAGKFDGDEKDLPAHFKRNRRLMNIWRPYIFEKKKIYPNIKRFILSSLKDDEDDNVKALGVNLLNSLTIACFTKESVRMKYIENIQILQTEKTKLSAAIVISHIALASGAAWIPVPALDSIAITAIQISMIVALFKIWGVAGVDLKSSAKAILKAVLPSLTMWGVGYGVAQALKFIPFYGTVVGGALSMTVASTGTLILGTAVTLFLRNKVTDISQVSSADLESMMKNFMENQSLSNLMNIDLANVDDEGERL
jgi:uncharacterized protein (DUF697 family)